MLESVLEGSISSSSSHADNPFIFKFGMSKSKGQNQEKQCKQPKKQ